ncbi:MAG: hypothetical protein IH594_01625 [Bacteroidales bacterium]|nr:hypothetical protein [Bacteroidales bacterium]
MNEMTTVEKRKLKPVLVGKWWLIGPPPPASDQIPVRSTVAAEGKPGFEPVDHNIFRAEDGTYHLWGCIRKIGYGRILYHWSAKRLTESPWKLTGEFIRCDRSAGECIDDWSGQEWMQSPYFVKENARYYMFYGGHSIGRDKSGIPVSGMLGYPGVFKSEGQICLMTSEDGLNWKRHLHNDGFSRVFWGPGEARDPCVIKVDDLYYMYYAGYEDGDQYNKGGVFLRTSKDLINWSAYSLVLRDPTFGTKSWDHECPFVAYREGYFYLFRTVNYSTAETYVYRSENPRFFGTNAESAQSLFVCRFDVAAAEIYQFDGKEYVSSNHNPSLGTQISEMEWEPV